MKVPAQRSIMVTYLNDLKSLTMKLSISYKQDQVVLASHRYIIKL